MGGAPRQVRERGGQVRPGDVEDPPTLRAQQAARRPRAARPLQARRRRGLQASPYSLFNFLL